MDTLELITATMTLQRLKEIAEKRFGDRVKGVADAGPVIHEKIWSIIKKLVS